MLSKKLIQIDFLSSLRLVRVTHIKGVKSMNKARLIQLIMASVLAIAFILSAEGLMCRAFSQQFRSEPSVPIHSPGPDLWILVLNSADGPPFSKPDETGIIDLVLKEAFRRMENFGGEHQRQPVAAQG